MGNMSNSTQQRVNRVMDDGPDQRSHWDGYNKAPTDHMRMKNKGEPEGFKSGLRQYKEELKKNKGLKHQDDYGGNRQGYGGGRYKGRYDDDRGDEDDWFK